MPRQVDHAQRRFEIVTAVWQVMATRGPAAVTMRTVAAEAGVSVGRIQHYFPTKDAMLEHGLLALLDAARGSLEVVSGRTPRDALLALLTHAVPGTAALRVGTAVWYSYLALGVDSPRIAELLREAMLTAHELGAELLVGLGVAAPDAPGGARDLLALADGLAQRVLVHALEPDDAVVALVDRVDALAPREG